jgi:hypothetical protein
MKIPLIFLNLQSPWILGTAEPHRYITPCEITPVCRINHLLGKVFSPQVIRASSGHLTASN